MWRDALSRNDAPEAPFATAQLPSRSGFGWGSWTSVASGTLSSIASYSDPWLIDKAVGCEI